MKVLVTGNMGYIGSSFVQQFRAAHPKTELIGFDIGYFAQCLTNARALPERVLEFQHFGDLRNFPAELLKGVDAIVHLAAISNDPMGKTFEAVTLDINHASVIKLAKAAKAAGVKSFIFASSCSVYGSAGDGPRNEQSAQDPLTAYAVSKANSERDLAPLADERFQVTCMRFATACGMSDRLRLDLVVNDFVASAIASRKINILSDGTPWRPLIHVKDFGLAIDWAIHRPLDKGGAFLVVNVGSDLLSFQVKDLAKAVADQIPGIEIFINKAAPPDKRSYRVDFSLFKSLAPNHQPKYDIEATVRELKTALEEMRFQDGDFRNSGLMRLNTLTKLKESRLLTDDLRWAARS